MSADDPAADAPDVAALVGAVGLADARWSPSGRRLAWLASGADGVALVVRDSGAPPRELPDVDVARGAARSGGGVAWASDDEVVVALADGRLVAVGLDGIERRTLLDDGRAIAPAVHPATGQVACVRETDDACDVVVMPLDGSLAPTPISGAAWAWDPSWAPDGRALVWQEWDDGAMPWDASRVVLSGDDGPLLAISGAGAASAPSMAAQPRFSPSGRELVYVGDAGGWANLWRVDRDGLRRGPLLAEPFEAAEPPWSPGQRSFAWSPDGATIAVNRNEDGFGRLVLVDLASGATRERSRGWHRWLDWGPRGIACVRSGGRTIPQVAVVEPEGRGRDVLATALAPGIDVDLDEPEVVTWEGEGGAPVPGILWRRRAEPERAPVLVQLHGGPTDQSLVDWTARVRWFVARGWNVLCPNPRGSTGAGLAWRDALRGGWGVRDVDDVARGIRRIGPLGWGDPERVALLGGSAGGFTALHLACVPDARVRVAVAWYPVTDLVALARDTHRFEARYLDLLVGPLPAARARYEERSLVGRGDDVTCPVLLLQGRDDPVVPPSQANALVDAWRARGATVEHHEYEGEAHGWRAPATAVDALERTAAFMERHIGGGGAR